MRRVEVCSYKDQWVVEFNEEAEKLECIFGSELIAIYHIGSTSVPGLVAKPVIDMMPVVKDISEVDQYNEAMQEIGYVAKGENGLSGRRYFQKGGDNRSHHVHMYQQGSDEIIRHIAFRDYVREHPDEAKEYGKLKERLAEQFPYDMESYLDGKDLFVKNLEQKALEWYDRQL
ncbi:GrpB family protein [Aquibacillus koreensis]|uniref:GrpB family protein n=1 Tax=Aquibacillus koreensis TaxID=279446 RepID=A0A9X3WIS6_9BACI|nr:GrpB family protein [Aquibacillus koreensis]MCT2536030.1 GrpB family protein [Aquibacillus koreensis]MDC3420485.1 GrpB family protein [Aquibacillus koreensis]